MISVLAAVSPPSSFDKNFGIPLVGGLINGLGFSLIALGIVLIYKSNKVFNFAQAEFATVAALFAAEAHAGAKIIGLPKLPGFPLLPSMGIGLLAGTGAALLTERLVIRPLFSAPRTTLLVATVGAALTLIALQQVIFGKLGPNLPLEDGDRAFRLFGYFVQVQDLVVLAVVAGLGAAAVVFFRSRYGLAILAVSQEPTAASTVGISVTRISLITWGIAGLLASLAGLVLAPKVGTAPGEFTFFGTLVSGFVAAVIGGMTSLPGAFIGGLSLGVIESLGQTQLPGAIPGATDVSTAAVLILILLIRPKGLLGKEA